MTYEEKLQLLNTLQNQVSSMSQYVSSKANQLDAKEAQLRQGQQPVRSARNLKANLNNNMGPMLAPGNLGDINKVIWPYYFSTDIPDAPISNGETWQTGFSVTQEAAFIAMSYTKVVYDATGPLATAWQYLDPNEDGVLNLAPGLVFTLRDGSSSRQFFGPDPMQLQNYGNPRFPTKLPRPIMLLPNQTMEINFINTNPSKDYVPFITVFGYRIRIDDAQNLLSLVYA